MSSSGSAAMENPLSKFIPNETLIGSGNRTEVIPSPDKNKIEAPEISAETIINNLKSIKQGVLAWGGNLKNKLMQNLPGNKNAQPNQPLNQPPDFKNILSTLTVENILLILNNPNNPYNNELSDYLKKNKGESQKILNRIVEFYRNINPGDPNLGSKFSLFFDVIIMLFERGIINQHIYTNVFRSIRDIVDLHKFIDISESTVQTYLMSANPLNKMEGMRLFLKLSSPSYGLENQASNIADFLVVEFKALELGIDNPTINERIINYLALFADMKAKGMFIGTALYNFNIYIADVLSKNSSNNINIIFFIIKTPLFFDLLDAAAQNQIFKVIEDQLRDQNLVMIFVLQAIQENDNAKVEFGKYFKRLTATFPGISKTLLDNIFRLHILFNVTSFTMQTTTQLLKGNSIRGLAHNIVNLPNNYKSALKSATDFKEILFNNKSYDVAMQTALSIAVPPMTATEVSNQYQKLREIETDRLFLKSQNIPKVYKVMMKYLQTGTPFPLELHADLQAGMKLFVMQMIDNYSLFMEGIPLSQQAGNKDLAGLPSPKGLLKLILDNTHVDISIKLEVKDEIVKLISSEGWLEKVPVVGKRMPEGIKEVGKNKEVITYLIVALLEDNVLRNLMQPELKFADLQEHAAPVILEVLQSPLKRDFSKMRKIEKDMFGIVVSYLQTSSFSLSVDGKDLENLILIMSNLKGIAFPLKPQIDTIFAKLARLNPDFNARLKDFSERFRKLNLNSTDADVQKKYMEFISLIKNIKSVRPGLKLGLTKQHLEEFFTNSSNKLNAALILIEDFFELLDDPTKNSIMEYLNENIIDENPAIMFLLYELSQNTAAYNYYINFIGTKSVDERSKIFRYLVYLDIYINNQIDFESAAMKEKFHGRGVRVIPKPVNILNVLTLKDKRYTGKVYGSKHATFIKIAEGVAGKFTPPLNAVQAGAYYKNLTELVNLLDNSEKFHIINFNQMSALNRILTLNIEIPNELSSELKNLIEAFIEDFSKQANSDLLFNNIKRYQNSAYFDQFKNLLINLLNSTLITNTSKDQLRNAILVLIGTPVVGNQIKIILMNNPALLQLLGNEVQKQVVGSGQIDRIVNNLNNAATMGKKMTTKDKSNAENTLKILENSALLMQLIARNNINELKSVLTALINLFKVDSSLQGEVQNLILKLLRNQAIWNNLPSEIKFQLFEYIYATLANKDFSKEKVEERERASKFLIEVMKPKPQYLREFTIEFFALTGQQSIEGYATDFKHITKWDTNSYAKVRGLLRSMMKKEIPRRRVVGYVYTRLNKDELDKYYTSKNGTGKSKDPYGSVLQPNQDIAEVEIAAIGKINMLKVLEVNVDSLREYTGLEINQAKNILRHKDLYIQSLNQPLNPATPGVDDYIMTYLEFLEFFIANSDQAKGLELYEDLGNNMIARKNRLKLIVKTLLRRLSEGNAVISGKALTLVYLLYNSGTQEGIRNDIEDVIKNDPNLAFNDTQKGEIITSLRRH